MTIDLKNISSDTLEHLYFKEVQRNDFKAVCEILALIRQNEINLQCNTSENLVNRLILKKSKDTAIHICARQGYNHLMKILVEDHGANVDQTNGEGKSALHDAALFSNLEGVNFLIQKGANINLVKRADWTPLMLACTKTDDKSLEIVKMLLAQGADLQFVNKDGWNCCHLAARAGNMDVVKLLIEQTPAESRKLMTQRSSRNGRKPLHTAVMHGHLDIVNLLVNESTVDELNSSDHCGTTPLMDSCRFGKVLILDKLVKHGGDLYRCNKSGMNCLHIASEAGQTEMVQHLISHYKMNIDQGSTKLNMTALHWASKEGHVDLIKYLLKTGANTRARDTYNRNPLEVAEQYHKTDAVNIFKSVGL